MQLRQLQREMQRDLFGEASEIGSCIAETAPLATAARLGIYRHAYVARLTETLQDHYPVLHAILGDEDFEELGASYIRGFPSVHRSIRWFGRELADFLAAQPPFNEQPIFAEIARFEWTLAEAFDSADAELIGRGALEAVRPAEWADLTFSFHPSVRRLTFEWNTVAAWKAMTAGIDPPQPEPSPEAVEWLLWRSGLENYFRSLDPVEATAVDAALRGSSFAEICAGLTEHLAEEEVPLRAASLIATWLDAGLLTGLGR
jgi:hypothetical protein